MTIQKQLCHCIVTNVQRAKVMESYHHLLMLAALLVGLPQIQQEDMHDALQITLTEWLTICFKHDILPTHYNILNP